MEGFVKRCETAVFFDLLSDNLVLLKTCLRNFTSAYIFDLNEAFSTNTTWKEESNNPKEQVIIHLSKQITSVT